MVDFTDDLEDRSSPNDTQTRRVVDRKDNQWISDSSLSGNNSPILCGTSAPRPHYFNRLVSRHSRTSGSRKALPPGVESLTSPRTFASAQSTLASYTTAPSGPRHVWELHIQHRKAIKTPTDGSCSPSALNEPDQDFFEMLATTVFQEIAEYATTKLPFLILDVPAAKRTIRKRLLPLCGPTPANSPAANLIQVVINAVMNEVDTLRNGQPSPGVDRELLLRGELQHQISCRVYEFASLQAHLYHLVPERYWETPQVFSSEWLQYLSQRGITISDELNWSGRGQHVEYAVGDDEQIPLKPRGILGHGATGIVERVKCRRIVLARKTIRFKKPLTKEEAVTEVQHLQRLRHRHIIRLIGTYTINRNLAILIYPAAHKNLDDHLEDLAQAQQSKEKMPISDLLESVYFVTYRFIGCLSSAINYLHEKNLKHLDIKPTNILVTGPKVYIADFGIARSYDSPEESYTDTPVSFTRRYAAPEVISQSVRGFPADIFSLGCVFMEIVATSLITPDVNERDRLWQIREEGSDTSYYANAEAIMQWYDSILRYLVSQPWESVQQRGWAYMLSSMLKRDPEDRPTAPLLCMRTELLCCDDCDRGPEPFVASD
jgi:hypothetical protein